jgi:hypothetical protein
VGKIYKGRRIDDLLFLRYHPLSFFKKLLVGVASVVGLPYLAQPQVTTL